MSLYVVKTTDEEGEEWLNGPFATKEAAFVWADVQADTFLRDNKVPRSALDTDGATSVWVEPEVDEFVFQAEVLHLNPPF